MVGPERLTLVAQPPCELGSGLALGQRGGDSRRSGPAMRCGSSTVGSITRVSFATTPGSLPGPCGSTRARMDPITPGAGPSPWSGQSAEQRRAWARSAGAVGDDGEVLVLNGGRLRATYQRRRDRASWTGRTTIDPNHSAQVEGDHYLSSHTPPRSTPSRGSSKTPRAASLGEDLSEEFKQCR